VGINGNSISLPASIRRRFMNNTLNRLSLKGKVAIVTGAGRGIGRGIALLLAESGAKVLANDLGLERGGKIGSSGTADSVVDEIVKNGGIAVPNYDTVATAEGADKIIKAAIDSFKRIDILVNNAGGGIPIPSIMDAEEASWDIMMNTNLKSTFLMCQRVARIMKNQGGGNIVNMGSVWGMVARPNNIYGVAKAGIIALTKNMAKDWGQYNIRVNALAPGGIKTPGTEFLWGNPALAQQIAKGTALDRWGSPEDVASVVLFLVSDISPHITGIVVPIDGGELVGSSKLD
jgi:NAD(P)-dependent dehydrogenase (short-subunit alcohol dehydrogenase family)